MRRHWWSEDAAEDRDHLRVVPASHTEKAQGLPASQPRETQKSRSSSPETVLAAGTPRTECLAPTNRSRGKRRTGGLLPAQSESARPSDFRDLEMPRAPLRNPVAGMRRIAVDRRDRKLFAPTACEFR